MPTSPKVIVQLAAQVHSIFQGDGVADEDDLRKAVTSALDALLIHRLECEDCRED